MASAPETQDEVPDLPHEFHLFIEANSADISDADFNELCDGLKKNSYPSIEGVTEIQPHGSRGAFVKFKTKKLSSDAIPKLIAIEVDPGLGSDGSSGVPKEKMIGAYSLFWKNNKLRIWNVPHNWTEDLLKEAMRKQVGRDSIGVLSVHFKMEEGYSDRQTAIILFCNKSCAVEAMTKMSEPGIKLGAYAPIVNWENHEDFVVRYTIEDKESYIKFITELREKLVSGSSSNVVDYIFERDRAYPVIGKKAGWIFIELNPEDGRTTTLAIWKENLYVLGFRTQEHGWFELGESDKTLPKEYKANKLGWGVRYTDIMKLKSGDQVEKTLMSTRLGKAFAERAVRRLARYSEQVKNDDDRPTRLGLAGLIVMICEAARMNPFLDTFAGGWNEGTGLTMWLAGILWHWKSMSAALLRWKDSGYSKWPVRCKHRLADALASVHLVLNSRDVEGSDQAWVEIFGVEFPPNFNATGITITVSGKGDESHIIYKQEKQEYQKKAISVDEWIRIRVERAGVIITKEWDCLNPEGGYATGPDARAIFLDHSTRILVTYMVMTDAIEANVDVIMVSADMEYNARGRIAARIDGFGDEYKINLFNSQTPCNTLTLPPRSDVRVPHGKGLHITTENLVITDASGNQFEIPDHTLTSDSSSPTSKNTIPIFSAADDTLHFILDLTVTWDTHQEVNNIEEIGKHVLVSKSGTTIERDLTCNMRVKKQFAASIKNLRLSPPIFSSRYVHIELQVLGWPGEKSSTIILAVQLQGDGVGFMNESGVWYGSPLLSRRKYNSVPLGWGNNYKDILQASDWDDDFMDKLNPKKLTVKGFAKAAVRTLSRYPDVVVKEGDINPRAALVGLMIMFRESTKWEPFRKFFVEGWSDRMKFTPDLIAGIK